MAALPQPRLTPEQYLELERAVEFRHEYYQGRMYPVNDPTEAMAGGSPNHSLIKVNLSSELREALKQRPCRVFDSDMRVSAALEGLYAYPDITVVCSAPQYVDGRKDTLLNPVLVAEVLSPSTEGRDRGFKATQYRSITSLQEYVLVSQTEPRVEIHRRRSTDEWSLIDIAGLVGIVELASITCRVPMAEIYDKVEFEAA